jgi:hypothetical protein
MANACDLEDLVGAMEILDEFSRVYLSRSTGDIILLTDEDFNLAEGGHQEGELEHWEAKLVELVRRVEGGADEDLIELPRMSEEHEVGIIERFSRQHSDQEISDEMLALIRGEDGLRRFKNALGRLGVEEQFYDYRHDCLLEVVREWCEANGVEYLDGGVDNGVN